MNVDLVIALLLGLIGVLLLVVFFKVFFSALFGRSRELTTKLKLKQKLQLIEEADQMIENENWAGALGLLKQSFYLEALATDSDTIEQLSNHHLGILSRLLIVTEKRSRQLPNLAVVEDLLLSRRDMMRSYLVTLNSKAALLKKRASKVPAWAIEEYKNSLAELSDKLTTNKRSLESQIEKLFQAASANPAEEQVTYH